MKITHDIASRHWYAAAEEQLAREYRSRGYEVQTEARLGEFDVDIYAKKGDDVVVVELKKGNSNSVQSKQISALRNYVVHQLGGRFLLYFVKPPEEASIEIEGLDELLAELLRENPGNLMDLATHVMVEEVDGIEIHTVSMTHSGTRVLGAGTVYIELQYGSSGDLSRGDGVVSSDSYPFEFDLLLDSELNVSEVNQLEVDTSSFYE